MKKLLFLILTFLNIIPLISQNTYSLNGIIIWESEGILYNISTLDTAKIDVNFITIKYTGNADSTMISNIEGGNNLNKYYSSRTGSITYKINVNNTEYLTLISNLASNQNIDKVYFEYLLKYSNSDPDDPFYESMNFDHIKVPYAWNSTTGHPDVIVGIIDNGCNWEHLELTEIESEYGNIFLNLGDPWDDPTNPNSGIIPGDEDENDYDDDYKGWDFYGSDNDVRPESEDEWHGTAMAGLVAAKTYNDLLVSGIAGGWGEEGIVSPGVRILPIRCGDEGYFATGAVPPGIEYAVDMGAKILNFSWGEEDWYDQQIDEAINLAWEQGVIMFAAAGHYYPDGEEVYWPATHENVVAVGAADENGNCKWDPSNYGPDTELTGIGSTSVLNPPDNISAEANTSTSAACATASGAAALILSYNPCLTNSEVRELLKTTAWESTCNGSYVYVNGHNTYLGYGIIDLEVAFNDLITNDPVINEPVEIDGPDPVTWDELKKVHADITIYSGGIFIITAEVQMYKDRKIIVMPGGELIVDGGIITNACDGKWKGIEVWGDASVHQFECHEEIHQGKITILNGGTIENAEIGVLLGARDPANEGEFDHEKSGGIIQVPYGGNPQVYDANFINNTNAVRFISYQNHLYDPDNCNNTKPVGNLSFFKNCWFDINEDYDGATFGSHVYLYDVDGIDFHFCTFENNYSETPSGHGINAYSSGFSIEEICDESISPCPENYQNRSSFTNFYKAVNSLSSGIYTTTVINTDFIDNSIGVYISDVDFATIILSDFNVDENVIPGTSMCSYGIYLDECSGFAIEDNNFEKTSGAPVSSYFGIWVSNTRAQDEIYRNTFEDFNYANLAIGKNWREDNIWEGLQYLCNGNTENYKDFLVLQDDEFIGGVQSKQGALDEAAGNEFSSIGTGDFYNLGNFEIDYYYWPNDQNQVPELIYGVTPISVSIENTCPSHYGGGGSGGEGRGLVLSPGEQLEAEQEFADGLLDYNNVNVLYENLVDGGSTIATLTDVETAMPGDMWELREALLGKSPHLSMEVLLATADKTEVLPESVIFEIMAANPDELKKEELLKYLEEKEEPLPQYMIDILNQLTGNVTYKTILQQQLGKHGWEKSRAAFDIIRSQLNDTEIEFTELRNWLDNLATQRADEQIIESYLKEGNYTDALTLANLIPGLYELDGDELTEHNYYMDMLDFTINLSQDGRNIFELNDTELLAVENIAENSNGLAGIQAKNILGFVYGHDYCNCPDIPDATGSKSSSINMNSFKQLSGMSLTVEPVPARQWTAFNYSLPDNNTIGEIRISDVSGKVVEIITIKGQQGQKVWDTRKINSGVYFYSFKVIGITETGKIVVSN